MLKREMNGLMRHDLNRDNLFHKKIISYLEVC